ncbi:hypothetical protein MP638_004276, partial [Amoeboaphelidium occidentale]
NVDYQKILLFVSSHGVSEDFAKSVNDTGLKFGKYPIIRTDNEEYAQKWKKELRNLEGGEVVLFQRGFADLLGLLKLWRYDSNGRERGSGHSIEIVFDSCYSGKMKYNIVMQSSCGTNQEAAVDLFFKKFFEIQNGHISETESDSANKEWSQNPAYYKNNDTYEHILVLTKDIKMPPPPLPGPTSGTVISAEYSDYHGKGAIYAVVSDGNKHTAMYFHYKEQQGVEPKNISCVNTGNCNLVNSMYEEQFKETLTNFDPALAQYWSNQCIIFLQSKNNGIWTKKKVGAQRKSLSEFSMGLWILFLKVAWDDKASLKIEVPEEYKDVVEELQQERASLLKKTVKSAEQEGGYQS